MMHQLVHSNGVTDTQGVDSSGMARPGSLTISGANASWSSGAYSYDDHGNLTKIITNGSTRNLSVNTKTNRLTAATYDSAGNLLSVGSGSSLQQYQVDAFNMMSTVQSTTEARGYVYTADDERMVEFDFAENPWVETWTIRGLDKKVLRQWKHEGGAWSWSKDYIYRGSLLLASEEPEATQHLHLDHLGTPRLITTAAGGGEVGRHTYFPFGAEVTDASQDGERMKFTGHERDLGGVGGGDDLDYMHARHYSPHLCRFLAMDPAPQSVTLGLPQSWNKYAYVGNNPIRFVDPAGLERVQVQQNVNAREVTNTPLALTAGQEEGLLLLAGTAISTVNPFPGPEDVLAAGIIAGTRTAAAAGKAGGALARFAKFLKRVFKKADGAPGGGAGVGSKIAKQMGPRGWTREGIEEAVTSGNQIKAINKATGNPATRFVHPKTRQSVVVDNVTGEVIHVGGPGFKYGPGSGDLP